MLRKGRFQVYEFTKKTWNIVDSGKFGWLNHSNMLDNRGIKTPLTLFTAYIDAILKMS